MVKPIVIALIGGLGNQIFQYATGLAAARARGVPLVLDLTHFSLPGVNRRYALDAYALDAAPFAWMLRVKHDDRIATARPSLRELRALARRSPGAALRRLLSPDSWRALRLVAEAGFDFDPAAAAAGPGSYLFGYWQSQRYFESIAPALRRTFRQPRVVDDANRAWLDRIAGRLGICVHVRRGDYLRPDLVAVHGACSAEYYRRALALLRERVPDASAFVFSDDRDWARAALPGTVVVDANGPDQAAQELMLMAACRHHVIANSSLSWWGAWLAAAPGQVVIAPTPWFTHGRPTPDLLPAGWIALPRE